MIYDFSQMENQKIIKSGNYEGAIRAWASGSTTAGSSHQTYVGEKTFIVSEFVGRLPYPPQHATPNDVSEWIEAMRAEGKEETTIYSKVSKLSSFYKWFKENSDKNFRNPVDPVRPKPIAPYQSDAAKGWTNDEMNAIMNALRKKSIRTFDDGHGQAGRMTALRDLTMLTVALTTGMRRSEFCGIMTDDVKFYNDHITISCKVKGGQIVTRRVDSELPRKSIEQYMRAWGKSRFPAGSPLFQPWAKPGVKMTSENFVISLRKAAESQGIKAHCHQTRHTAARIVADASGSMTDTQEFLGHTNSNTTRIYVQRIGIRKDRGSDAVAAIIGE